MYTIRRHLSKGKNFGHFQIRGHITDSKQGPVVEYVNPETHSIIFEDCKLHNKINQSRKIFDGANKQPCAYIICKEYLVVPKTLDPTDQEISFNPRQSPHWRKLVNGIDSIIDSQYFQFLITSNTKLYALSNRG